MNRKPPSPTVFRVATVGEDAPECCSGASFLLFNQIVKARQENLTRHMGWPRVYLHAERITLNVPVHWRLGHQLIAFIVEDGRIGLLYQWVEWVFEAKLVCDRAHQPGFETAVLDQQLLKGTREVVEVRFGCVMKKTG